MPRISLSVPGSLIRASAPARSDCACRLDHGRQLGMLARQLDEGVAGRAGRHLGFQRLEAVNQSVQFGGGYHGPVPNKKAAAIGRGRLMSCE
jgi:hypothetical protein